MLAVVFVASIGYFRGQHFPEPGEQPEIPQDGPIAEKRMPAPETEFNTKAGGAIKVSSLKGKVVLLSFWAHWCAPCLVELPSFKVLHTRLGNPDFVVVPVNIDERDKGQDFIKNFWETKSLPFDTYFDPDKKAAIAFKVETLPSNFVLDRQGRIVMASFGSNDWSNDTTVEMIESLLNEK
ncbi:MAG: TlpA disulfide reductase family protein [Bdellovibrionia bacterium]